MIVLKLSNMKEYSHFFGVDVSKKTVDITHAHNDHLTHRQFAIWLDLLKQREKRIIPIK